MLLLILLYLFGVGSYMSLREARYVPPVMKTTLPVRGGMSLSRLKSTKPLLLGMLAVVYDGNNSASDADVDFVTFNQSVLFTDGPCCAACCEAVSRSSMTGSRICTRMKRSEILPHDPEFVACLSTAIITGFLLHPSESKKRSM